ncbi:MAG TPA: hypothetical protein VMU75_00530 [Acidimicrobiales bacterium]|nr:hypothetical protein [Acidimicrobiales bacterium]
MRGRWAAGIVPRNFAWIIKDQLAVSERPGGYAPHHRRVRRQEEILWLNAQGFTRIVSLLPSTHNLHAYEELHIPSSHFPLPVNADVRAPLSELYPALLDWLRAGERILVHQEELGERVAGVVAGFLCWSGALPEPPRAISAVEQLLKRQLGSAGRSIVALVPELPPPGAPVPPRPPGATETATPAESPDADAGASAGERSASVPPAPAPAADEAVVPGAVPHATTAATRKSGHKVATVKGVAPGTEVDTEVRPPAPDEVTAKRSRTGEARRSR